MKRTYNTPAIEEIWLDNEISLQLASGDPTANTGAELMKRQEPQAAAPDADPYQYESW